MTAAQARKRQPTLEEVLKAGDIAVVDDTIAKFIFANDLPMAIVDKRRYGDDEKPVAENVIGDVSGKHCIIVDDEVASGGTLIEAAAFLMKEGAKSVEATCVHPVLSGTAVSKITDSPINKLVVCNTIPTVDKRFPKLTVLPVAPLFAKAFRRIHDGDSVSELFV